ncbi:MAG: PEP-CTERM sorting domain-containing protein [Phycisphaerales bacterium]
MKRKLRYLLVLAAVVCFAGLVQAISYTTLDYPGAKCTYITGIDGDTIVGYYSNYGSNYEGAIDPHGFVYDGQTWTTLDCPRKLASSLIYNTTIEGINNGKIVGNCRVARPHPRECGFIYDGQTWTLLDFPGAGDTYIQGIDGSNIAGYYQDETGLHGFVYNGTTWNTLLYPWTNSGYVDTSVVGISGNNVAICDYGYYGTPDSVIYNIENQTWSTIELPGAGFTGVMAIDGSNIVGGYGEGEGYEYYFLYDGTSWTTFDFSFSHSSIVAITDMDGDNIVGHYSGSGGVHGFIATIPEPATLALLVFGGLILRKRK